MNSIFTVNDWSLAASYQKNDAVKYNGKFYYALNDISANTAFSTSIFGGYRSDYLGEKPDFIWKLSFNTDYIVDRRLKNVSFDGYTQISEDGINYEFLTIQTQFDNRKNQETAAILHFLQARQGTESFYLKLPPPYDVRRIFICSDWNTSNEFLNNNTITATFIEKYN